jgi:signal recognition particle subunit SRP19
MSRKEGRRVPKSKAVKSPDASKIFDAANKLGLNPIIEQATYPKQPWIKTGVIIVDKVGSKTKIIRDISEIISN